ncbi:MAG TPA: PAS domain-containing protein, partial [Phenylobacterium sp.]|nr:PAS domain-containing protein [Phenylobacterium sp.]
MDAESASAERLRRLQMAVEASGLGLWEWDVRSGALTWNARNRELFGVDPDRPLHIGEYISLVHPKDRERVRAAYREVRDQPEGGDYVIEHRTSFEPEGKARWVQARGRVVRDADGIALVVGSTLDITDRKA